MTTTVGAHLVEDLDDADYHASPALSASGAKKLLPPSCPARYHYEREHGQPPKQEFDVGKAAHALVLGAGDPIDIVEAPDYRTKAAQQRRDEIRAHGGIPVLRHEHDAVIAMADAVLTHPIAAALFDGDHGRPEVSAFWTDTRHGIDRRVRFDWLPDTHDGRLIVPDLKTTPSADPGTFVRSVANYGYDLQAAYYLDGIKALGLADDAAFVFVAVEKTPPHLIAVFELDGDWLRIGHEKTQRACSVFAECTATGQWPGYTSDVELLSPPAWLARSYEGIL